MKILTRFVITTLLLCIATTANSRQLSSSEKTELMKNYNATVRVGINMITGGSIPLAEAAVKCDSLRYYLYEDTVSVPLFYQVASRLTVETYNIVAKTGKTDYHQIEMALNSCKNVPAFYDIYFLQCAMALSEYRLEQKNYKQAETACLLARKCAANNNNGISVFLPVIHLQLINITSQAGKYIDAAKWTDIYIKDLEMQNKGDSDEYYEFLNIMGYNQKMAGLKHAADSTYTVVCDKLKSKGLCRTNTYMDALISRAEINPSDDKFEELLELANETGYLFDEILIDAASFYYDTRNFDKMSSCLDRALKAVESDGSKVAMLTGFLPMLNAPVIKSGYASRVLNLLIKNIDLSDLSDCAVLATAYANCGEYTKAAKEAIKVKKMADAMLLENNSDVIAEKMNNVVNMFVSLYDFDNAIYYTEQAMPHYEKAYDKIMPSYTIEQKELLASYYTLNGDFHTSRKILMELVNNPDVQLENIYSIGMKLADVTLGIGNFEALDKYCDDMLKNDFDAERRWYFMNLKTTALISWIDVAYDRESEEFKNKLSKLEKSIDENNRFIVEYFPNDVERKIECTLNSAAVYFFTNNIAEMKKSADEIEKLTHKFIHNQELKDNYLSSLAMFYIKSGDCSKALKLIDTKSGQFELEKIINLQIQSEAYLAMGKKDKAQQAYTEMSNLIMLATQHNFSMLTEKEKMKNWRKYEQQLSDAGRFAVENDPESKFGGVVYNLALYSKGLLLNSSKTFAGIMENNSNPEVKELYMLLKNKRKQLADNPGIPADEKKQLTADAIEIELTLLDMVPESREYMKELKYDWTDLKKRLGDNDVAIEFLEFQNTSYERNYAATVVSKKLNNPVILNLGKVDETDNAIKSTFRADVVWKKLMPYLSTEGRNYFSPVGKLHCLPIESLLTDDNTPLSAIYPMYRLSSTRELLKDKYQSGKGLVMFGGIDYGKSGSVTAQRVHRGVAYSLPYLPGTMKEMEAVAELIKNDSIAEESPELYSGADGSESNFKMLSGKKKRVVHIGTHGYYITSKSNGFSKLPYSVRRLFKNNDTDDNLLMNNGLFMAGVNIGKQSGDNVADDGVLTALEISEMDLSGVDMAVLSACETGLGTLSPDGVFGLQRGLKLAGINSIMMSLEKVDDEATCLLMTEFYRNYLSGHSKNDAFEKAKDIVRTKYPSQRQWASFILLDAID